MFGILPCHLRARCGAVLLSSLLMVAGCVTHAPQDAGTTAPPQATAPAATETPSPKAVDVIASLLQQAERVASPQRDMLLLQVSALYQQQSDYARMGRTLHEVRVDALSNPSLADYRLQYGDWALDQRRLDDAGRVLLDPALDKDLTDNQRSTLYGLRARLFELQGKPIDALNQRIGQSVRTPEAGQAAICTAIWRLLGQMSDTDLAFLENADSSNTAEEQQLTGWLALTRIQRNSAGDASKQAAAIEGWKRSYPVHPANRHMPADLAATSNMANPPAQHIALLLPLTGKWAAAGQALRDGFMTMHYQHMAAHSNVQSSAANVQIDLVDSSASPDFLATYQQVVAKGAQLVIGPLEREQVQALANQSSLPVTTLALNNPLSEGRAVDTLFQFSLNPEDDVGQVVSAAAANQYRRALVIAPRGERGERLVQAFTQRWQSLGGSVEQVRYAPNTGNYSAAIAEGLGIDMASGQWRAGKAAPDMVFLVSNGSDASFMMEALARNGAKAVPVYATGDVLDGHLDARTNGLRVCLPPWQVGVGPLRTANISIPASGIDGRLFAMGADAETLYTQLAALNGSSLQVVGNTGYLSMDSNRRVIRKLVWAVMQDGKPVAQPATADGRF